MRRDCISIFLFTLYLGGYLYNYDSLQGVYNEKGERIYGDPEDYSIDGGNEPNDGEGKPALNGLV